MNKLIFAILTFGLLLSVPAQANNFRSTDLPLPRFVSLDSSKVYARTGPGRQYPIKWVYQRNQLPVEIIQEYDSWRKVKDIKGEGGWIHTSLLSGRRTALVNAAGLVDIRDGLTVHARIIAQAEPGVVAQINKCAGHWCKIKTGGYNGWVERKFLWGIYEGEELN